MSSCHGLSALFGIRFTLIFSSIMLAHGIIWTIGVVEFAYTVLCPCYPERWQPWRLQELCPDVVELDDGRVPRTWQQIYLLLSEAVLYYLGLPVPLAWSSLNYIICNLFYANFSTKNELQKISNRLFTSMLTLFSSSLISPRSSFVTSGTDPPLFLPAGSSSFHVPLYQSALGPFLQPILFSWWLTKLGCHCNVDAFGPLDDGGCVMRHIPEQRFEDRSLTRQSSWQYAQPIAIKKRGQQVFDNSF